MIDTGYIDPVNVQVHSEFSQNMFRFGFAGCALVMFTLVIYLLAGKPSPKRTFTGFKIGLLLVPVMAVTYFVAEQVSEPDYYNVNLVSNVVRALPPVDENLEERDSSGNGVYENEEKLTVRKGHKLHEKIAFRYYDKKYTGEVWFDGYKARVVLAEEK